jgi:hypothetical protein
MVPLNLTTTDAWKTISCPGTVRVTLQVSNAAIAIGFGKGGPARYTNDEQFLPIIGSLERRCDEIRIRSLVAGQPAVVMGSALTVEDVG